MILQPLAYRMRPESLDDVVGQQRILGTNGILRRLYDQKTLFSLILFGPPGCGKTTVATLLAGISSAQFRLTNATTTNKKEMETLLEEAKMYGHLVIIMDEVHRLNKDKQDFFLPHVESGLFTLIGTTTANPYHSINPAIRSRCHLIEFVPLEAQDIHEALVRALHHPNGLQNLFTAEDLALEAIAKSCGGDIRFALNQLEVCALASEKKHISIETVRQNTRIPQHLLDRNDDGHYDAVSALQKSIRGSDVDAALYYLARLIAANDLDSIERRLLVTAYEDIGLANPQAVQRTYNAIQTAKIVGFPEATIPLGFAVCDLALSPKSKSACEAIAKAMEHIEENVYPVPRYLRLTPHNLSEEDSYPYDRPDLWEKIQYLPEAVKDLSFYQGNSTGSYERALLEQHKRLKHHPRTANLRDLKKQEGE